MKPRSSPVKVHIKYSVTSMRLDVRNYQRLSDRNVYCMNWIFIALKE